MNTQSIVINFEADVPGTVISDQFAGHGITFGPPGLQPVIAAVPPGRLPEDTQVLDISNRSECEIPVADLAGRFRYQGPADLEARADR